MQSLRKIDLFGQQISLRIANEWKHKTIFGGIATIVMIGILVLFLFSKFEDFIYRNTVNVSNQSVFSQDPPNINLTKDKFMFAVSIEQGGEYYPRYLDKPFFHIIMEQRTYLVQDNGKDREKIEIPVALEPCTVDHWKHLKGGADYEKAFATSKLEEWLCPSEDSVDLVLGGQYTSDEFAFIKIKVMDCEDEPKEGYFKNWKHECASQDERDEWLKWNGNMRFQIMMSNFVVNPDNPDKIADSYFNEDFTFTFKPKNLYRSANIFFQDTIVKTDDQIYPGQMAQISTESFPVTNTPEMRETFDTESRKEGEHGAFFFRRSNNTQYFDRSFVTFLDLLSYIGGFFQSIYLVIGGIAILYNHQDQLINVANSLYYFDESDLDNKNKSKKQGAGGMMSSKKTAQFYAQQEKEIPVTKESTAKELRQKVLTKYTQKIKYRRKEDNIGQQITHELGFKNRLQFLTFQIQDYIFKVSNVSFGLQYLIYKVSFGKLFKTKKTILLEKGIGMAKQQVDLLKLVEKASEIDKLKRLILDKEQLTLFNFQPKPIVKIAQSKTSLKQSNLHLSKVLKNNESEDLEDDTINQVTQTKRSDIQKSTKKTDLKKSMFNLNKEKSKNMKIRNQFASELQLSVTTYMIVLKAKNKFLSVLDREANFNDGERVSEYMKLYKAYVNLQQVTQKDQTLSPYQLKINRQLLISMGAEMKDIFYTSNLLDFKVDLNKSSKQIQSQKQQEVPVKKEVPAQQMITQTTITENKVSRSAFPELDAEIVKQSHNFKSQKLNKINQGLNYANSIISNSQLKKQSKESELVNQINNQYNNNYNNNNYTPKNGNNIKNNENQPVNVNANSLYYQQNQSQAADNEALDEIQTDRLGLVSSRKQLAQTHENGQQRGKTDTNQSPNFNNNNMDEDELNQTDKPQQYQYDNQRESENISSYCMEYGNSQTGINKRSEHHEELNQYDDNNMYNDQQQQQQLQQQDQEDEIYHGIPSSARQPINRTHISIIDQKSTIQKPAEIEEIDLQVQSGYDKNFENDDQNQIAIDITHEKK